jgi:hypothetical protein
MLAWLATGLILTSTAAPIVWVCYRRQRRHEAARIVKAFVDRDPMELLLLLVERVDLHSVAEWFG